MNYVEYKTFYENGELNEVGTLENGIRNGEWLKYDINNNLKKNIYYVDGKLNGPCKIYDGSSKNRLHIECTYINDNLEGEYIIYWNIYENECINPEIIKESYYYENGKKMENINYFIQIQN